MLEVNRQLIVTILLVLYLVGCSSTSRQGTGNLKELSNLKGQPVSARSSIGLTEFRKEALKEMALSVSAQSGLAWRAKQLNHELEQHAKTLDRVFNFHAMLLDHNVLCPVLQEGRDTFNIADPNTIRIADRTYQIIKQAEFVSAPPSWRDYLWLEYNTPDTPVNSLLPKDPQERRLWKQYVSQGWTLGVKQAEDIFNENIAKLKQDYNGMILYRKLLAQGMVSPPYVGKTDLGVTGNPHELRVHDQVLRITALPNLQPNSKNWKAAIQR